MALHSAFPDWGKACGDQLGLKLLLVEAPLEIRRLTVDATSAWAFVGQGAWRHIARETRNMAAGMTVDRLPSATGQPGRSLASLPVTQEEPGVIRVLTVVFIKIPDLPDFSRTRDWIAETAESAGTYGGVLNKVSQDEKGTVLILLFGHAQGRSTGAAHAALTFLWTLMARPTAPPGAGASTGAAYLGPMGSEHRWEEAVLGHVVNRAARLAMHPEGGAWCDRDTLTAAASRHEVLVEQKLEFKGLGVLEAFRTRPRTTPALRAAGMLVGREEHLSSLEEALDRLRRRGEGASFLLTGEPGIGKSAIVAQIATQAESSGLGVLVSRGDVLGSLRPHAAWAPWVRLWQHKNDAGRSSGLSDLLDSEAIFEAGLDETTFHAREEAILSLLADAILSGPVLLVMDDLHEVDSASRDLWLKAQQRCPQALFLATTHVWPASSSYPGTIREILPLDDGAVTHLLALSTVGHRLSEASRLEMTTWARGNPFVLGQLLSWLESRDGQQLGLPDSVHVIVQQRVDQLPDTDREVLRIAALLGKDLTQEALRAVAERLAHPEADRAILQLIGNGWLMRDLDGSRLNFEHGLVREALVATQVPTTLRKIHREVAAHFIGRDGGVGHADRIARHLILASREADAVPWVMDAIREAMASMLFPEASAHVAFMLARESDWRGAEHTDRRLDLLEWHGFLLRLEGKPGQALQTYAELLAESTGVRHARIRASMAIAALTMGDHEACILHADRVLEEVPARHEEALRAVGFRSMALMKTGRAGEALERLETAIADLAPDDEREVAQRCRVHAAQFTLAAILAGKRPAAGVAGCLGTLRQELARTLRREGNPRQLAQLTNSLGQALWQLGEFPEARQTFLHSLECARRLQSLDDVVCAHLNLALVAREMGRWEEVRRQASSALNVNRGGTTPLYDLMASALCGLSEVQLGGSGQTVRTIHWRDIDQQDSTQRWYVLPLLLEAAACLDGDDGWKNVLSGLMNETEALLGCDDALRLLGLALVSLPENEAWESWKTLLQERVNTLPTPQGLGWLALASGDPEQMSRGLAALEAAQARPLASELHRRLALAEPDRQVALDHLDDALALALETGSMAQILRVRETELELLDLPLDDPACLQFEEDRGAWLAACKRMRYRMRPRHVVRGSET